MSIDGVSGRTSYIGTSIIGLRNQLNELTQQLASGKVSTTYAGQGADRGFALSLRAQVSSINAFANTATNVNTRIGVLNLALQGMTNIGTSVKSAASSSTIVLNNNGQTSGQITAQAAFSNAVSLLNSQSGDRYLFSGRTTDKAATVPAEVMLAGTGTQAGLTQLISERRQADQGVGNMAHLTVSSPPATTTVTSLGEDGSSFGLKLGAITSSLTGATVTQPAGAPPSATIDLGAVNPNNGDKISFNFNLPDGTSETISLTATTTSPAPAGSFLIGVDTVATTANLQAALTSSIQTLGDTALVAASAIAASDNFFNPSATITGSAVNNQAAVPAPITGATLLYGAAGTDSLAASFAAGDTITVNGTPITFVASGATGNQLNVTDSVQALLAKVDSISGATTPSTVNGGAIALHGADNENLSISSSNTAAFAALGFNAPATATPAPLRVNGPPFATATNLIGGTPANTVSWYTGEVGADSARGTAIARVDQAVTVQYGARANEEALRYQLQNIAVYAAVTTNANNPNSKAQINALQQRISANLAPQNGQQSIQDMQAEIAGAQTAIKGATDRQTQLKGMAQTMLDSIEGINADEVATKILALQTNLQASYQTTSMLYQTTLTKFLPI
ncbi:flagellar protein [Bradyrhizobium sp. AUGA SZCCT0160]|uniref:flagellar protein n=1 Tax=Bradyrhizobium sp. AUGA SZCCT0160 TaxID=2807662 RepID=UPI001BA5DDFF|nr:flagellar protein [Bradyrhizobium sp. AUGA SZCCT0160]MBR1194175.1 flagellar protein [Bradyrhizobium sp. AUGA SZCCT0160]